MIANLNFIVSVLFLAIATAIVGVEIRHMRVPSVLQNGSRPYVILDCDYDISSESEGRQVDVKWFFGNNPQPFYQWLPGRPPQTAGERFRGRIDLRYQVEGSDRFSKHRALKILRPTTELSGSYRCKVSSFVDEDFRTKTMIIYSPPREGDVSLIYSRPDENHINLTCSARGVFPKPDVTLSWGRRMHERGETTTLTVERDGLFDVAVNKMLSVDRLKPQTVFQCLLTIPGTQYSVKEETMYFPGRVLPALSSAGAISSSIFAPSTKGLCSYTFKSATQNTDKQDNRCSLLKDILKLYGIPSILIIVVVILQGYVSKCSSGIRFPASKASSF